MNYGLLDKLAIQYGTDKRSSRHGYTRYYEFYFSAIRNDVKKVLELGIARGSSLKMWRDYFPNAIIYGIDINLECSQYKDDRIEITIGNFNDPLFIPSFIQKYGENFDLIIDDASHIYKDQINAFTLLFQYIKPKGIYVIEDTNTSYWKNWGGGYKHQNTSIEFFKDRIDDVCLSGLRKNRKRCYANRDFLLASKLREFTEYERLIESIHFYSGLIILFKQ